MRGSKGAVAVEAEECSNIGIDSMYFIFPLVNLVGLLMIHINLVLKKGGNAVDAAIAANLCIGVIDSFATGK